MPLASQNNDLDPSKNEKMDDRSTSSWTAISSPSWRANFGWLPNGSSTSPGTTTHSQLKGKELEIVQCLQGNHQEDVDLWHLRQLALSPGGFVSTTLRKRAWPQVVGAHQLIFLQKQKALQEFVEPLPADVRQVHQLVRRTHWNMEEHLRHMRKEHIRHRDKHSASQPQQPQPHVVMEEEDDDDDDDDNNNNRPRKVSFVLPHTIHTTQRYDNNNTNITNGEDADDASVDSATLSLQSCSSIATRQEQQVLTNIILNLLRQPAGPPRYSPYAGIQSITAVLVLQLESPCLASFVLQQLASYSLRDYCVCGGGGQTRTGTGMEQPQDEDHNDDETPTTCNQSPTKQDDHNDHRDEESSYSFLNLLQRVDYQLWRHLTDTGISKTPDCIATSWIPCWFAQDIPHLDVVGRLWDVFLVSQPSCCLYMSVALTVIFRDVLLSTPPDFITLTEAFGRLPSQLCEPDETETVIATCLQYMERYPSPRQQQKSSSSSIPSWAMAPTAPNDWALLQQAKAMRNDNKITTTTQKTTRCEEDYRDAAVTLAMERFPQAAMAAGVTMSHPPSSMWRKLMWLFLFAVVGFAVGLCLCLRNDIPIKWTCWTMPAAEIQSEAIAKARTMMNRWALPDGASKYVPRQLFWEASSTSNSSVSKTEPGEGLLGEKTQTRMEQEAQRRYEQERTKATKLMEEASKQEEARNDAQAKTTQEEKIAQEQARIADSSRLVVERIAKEKRLAKEQKKARISKEAADEQTRLAAEGVRVSEEERVATEQARRLEAERIEKEQERLAQENEKHYRLEATARAEKERFAEQAKLEGEQSQCAAEEEARLETKRHAEESLLEAARIGQEERLLGEETNRADEAEIKAEDAKLQEEENWETEEKAGIEEEHHPAIEQSRSEAARLADETSEQARQAETDAREAVAKMMVGSEYDKKESRDSNDRPAGDDLNESPLMTEADIIDEAIRLSRNQEGGALNEKEKNEVLEDQDAVGPQQDLVDVLKSYGDNMETLQTYWKDPNEDDDNDSNFPAGIQITGQSLGNIWGKFRKWSANRWGKFRKWSANKRERRRVRRKQTRKEGK